MSMMSSTEEKEYRALVQKALVRLPAAVPPAATKALAERLMEIVRLAYDDGHNCGYGSGNDGEPYMP